MDDEDPIEYATSPAPEVPEPEPATWVPPTTEELQQLLPQYEILELIGFGGMGAVYKGRQLSLDRPVAIKILSLDAMANGNADYLERFKNEARLMARMNHPDIVTVHDFGETSDGHLYLIMEFVDGTDVSKMIESQGRLPPEYALAITAHICDALQYAHTHGVIHRDIKPGNVLINMEGEVKVADFGLAKLRGEQIAGVSEEHSTLGTPDYIAPEAMMIGVEVDRRADLYSVGVMLYQMLTGELPQGEYQPASQIAGCDVRYDAIISRSLQADREHRYQSAREIRRDLDDIIITPVVKVGDIASRAAIPKQLVHRRAVNAPIFKRPVASNFTYQPVEKNHTSQILMIVVLVVLAVGGYLWRKDFLSKQSPADDRQKSHEITAASSKSPASDSGAASVADVSEAFKPPHTRKVPPAGDNDGNTDSSPVPAQPSSDSTIASGDWTNVKLGDGAVHLETNNARFGPECHDGAIRAMVTAKDNPWSYLELRCDKEGNRYGFVLKNTNKAVIAYFKGKSFTGKVVKEVDFDKSIRHSDYLLEFRAVGRLLTGLVNGVEMLSVEDDRLSSGCFGIESKNSDAFRDIAVLNLDQANSSQGVAVAPANTDSVNAAPEIPARSADPRLAQLEAQFQQAYDRDIVGAREASVADLDAKYVAALDRADIAATRAGKTDEALRLKTEKQRVQEKQPISPVEAEPVPASLKQLRTIYADALAKIDQDCELKSRSRYDEFDGQLESLEKSLIEDQHTDDAQLVKAKRDQIAEKKTRH